MAQRAHGVAVPRAPMLRHRQPGELIVFRIAFVAPRAIDEMHEVVGVALSHRGQELGFLALLELVRELLQECGDGIFHLVHPLNEVRESARAARILDLLLPGRDFREVTRELAARAPEIDLKHQRVWQPLARHTRVRHKPLERRVRDEAAVPILLALDLDGWEAGWQCAACHHMLGSDDVRPGVEIDEVAAAHIDGAKAETRVPVVGVDPVEVDEALEGGFEWPRVIVARRLDRAGWMKPRIEESRLEEARRSGAGNHGGAHLIGKGAGSLALPKEADDTSVEAHGRRGDYFPEFAQPVDTSFRRIAGDDRGIDCADRNADDPVRMKPSLGQRLINTRLIGAERAAPLQQKRDAIEREVGRASSPRCPCSLRAVRGRSVFPRPACRARPDRAALSAACQRPGPRPASPFRAPQGRLPDSPKARSAYSCTCAHARKATPSLRARLSIAKRGAEPFAPS